MISVVIIAKNEEDLIGPCLESVKWADEVVVVLNESTDNTEKIVKNYTDKIIKVKGADFAKIRNEGMKAATEEWVLYVDADERVLRPLQEEIKDIIQRNDKSAYAVSRKNIIFGVEVNYGSYKNDWMIRLFKKDKFKEWVGSVHEYGTFDGELGYTKYSLLHLTHRDVDQITLKSLEWSKIDAELRLAAGHPNMSGWRFLRILFSELFNQGIKKRAFFSGSVATMDALMQTFSMIITYIRLWQLQQPKPLNKVYEDLDKKLIENDFKY